MVRALVVTLIALLATCCCSRAELYDVISPHLIPPAGGCKDWSTVPDQEQYWRDAASAKLAGSSCVQQGRGNPNYRSNADMGGGEQAHYVSAYCVSKVTGNLSLCTSGFGIPEQVNVQVASGDTVVIGWVTFEHEAPPAPPVVSVAGGAQVTGVTHIHVPCSVGSACVGAPYDRPPYYMHFVRLSSLTQRTRYTFKVKSGGAGAVWSGNFTFRSPYTSEDGQPTRIALYGDMGVYTWNNMQNLYEETTLNETADLIVHAGDHCYNEGDDDERRADAYMQAFEKVTANSLWMPIVGNHEFYAGTNLSRYLDQTWEKWGPIPGGNEWGPEEGLSGGTSATSALGALLSAQNHHAAGVHGQVPSRSSRYFSVDFGLTHLVALSLNGYNGVDLCTGECNQAQLAWLEQDLATVDRTKTPWVIAMSHYPMYLGAEPQGKELSKQEAADAAQGTGKFATEDWWSTERCEYEGHSKTCVDTLKGQSSSHRGDEKQAKTLASSANEDLEPLFMKYGVDIYWAGHIHFYNRFDGPVYKGFVIANGTHNPAGPIHSCTGNGGPPSATNCSCQEHGLCTTCIGNPYSYTRLTVYNQTDLLWEQISNKDNSIVDAWTVHQEKHGEFPIPLMSYDCDSPTNGMCRPVRGSRGQYKDERSCMAATECQGSWNCDAPTDGKCTHVTNSSGEFKSLSSCLMAQKCKGPPPPPPPGWECHPGMMLAPIPPGAAGHFTDRDIITKGQTEQSCVSACNNAKGCATVNWHETHLDQPTNHCHVLTGNVSHAEFLENLVPAKEPDLYTACIRSEETEE